MKTLKIFGTGQVTLPKEWRSKYDTDQFMAIETPQGLLIKPIEPIVYFEDDSAFGLEFPTGIPAEELQHNLETANGTIS
jgi:bifunctional DNA-binding transcriptional regulator/antitoxin component of YhaV-PrlF toxin-antitoxin module